MAIVVEEEKKSSNAFAFFGWVIVVAIIVAAIYYIFFVTPAPAVIAPSGAVGTIGSIPAINVNPQDIVGGAEFQAASVSILRNRHRPGRCPWDGRIRSSPR